MKEKKLDIKGFSSPNSSQDYRPFTLNIALFGPEGGGKSRFIGTAPDPIGGIILDMKSEMSIRRAIEETGKTIIWPDREVTNSLIYDLDLREIRKMVNHKDKDTGKELFMAHYEKRVTLMEDLLMELCHHQDIRTIFVDSFYQYCIEAKWAVQGPAQKFKRLDSGKVFQDNESWYQRIIKLLNRINVKHTILTHKWKDEYMNDAKTGRMVWEGFKYLGNHTNVAVELRRNEKAKPTKDDWRYRCTFRNCLPNETLQGPMGQPDETGLVDEAISFGNVARAIFTDVEEDVFEREFA